MPPPSGRRGRRRARRRRARPRWGPRARRCRGACISGRGRGDGDPVRADGDALDLALHVVQVAAQHPIGGGLPSASTHGRTTSSTSSARGPGPVRHRSGRGRHRGPCGRRTRPTRWAGRRARSGPISPRAARACWPGPPAHGGHARHLAVLERDGDGRQSRPPPTVGTVPVTGSETRWLSFSPLASV